MLRDGGHGHRPADSGSDASVAIEGTFQEGVSRQAGGLKKGMGATRNGLAVRKRWPGNLDSRISERTTEDSTGQVAWSMGAAHGIGKDETGRSATAGPVTFSGTVSHGRLITVPGRLRHGQANRAPAGAVVFRGAQTLSCTVIVCIEALANHRGRRMNGVGRMGRGSASLRRGTDL